MWGTPSNNKFPILICYIKSLRFNCRKFIGRRVVQIKVRVKNANNIGCARCGLSLICKPINVNTSSGTGPSVRTGSIKFFNISQTNLWTTAVGIRLLIVRFDNYFVYGKCFSVCDCYVLIGGQYLILGTSRCHFVPLFKFDFGLCRERTSLL